MSNSLENVVNKQETVVTVQKTQENVVNKQENVKIQKTIENPIVYKTNPAKIVVTKDKTAKLKNQARHMRDMRKKQRQSKDFEDRIYKVIPIAIGICLAGYLVYTKTKLLQESKNLYEIVQQKILLASVNKSTMAEEIVLEVPKVQEIVKEVPKKEIVKEVPVEIAEFVKEVENVPEAVSEAVAEEVQEECVESLDAQDSGFWD